MRPALAIVLLGLLCVGCSRSETPAPAPQEISAAPPQSERQIPTNVPDAPRVDGKRAMQYTKEIVAFGRRAVGSPGHDQLVQYLRDKLKSDGLEEDVFTAQTPAGSFEMRNLIAKFPGTRDGVIVLASHFDTNYPLKNYVGANDGGSSTALLLAIADQLRGRKREGYSVWLVFLDGEEAIEQWSATDSLYGSRHLAERWEKDGTVRKVRAFILADMIGDKDLNIDRDQNSTSWLLDVIENAAKRLYVQAHFFQRSVGMEDDHLPFAKRGVPVADLIDFEYGYGNVFHHTPQDTLDKLSPKSLEIVGNVMLQTVWTLDAMQ